jgi:hypothetical protein
MIPIPLRDKGGIRGHDGHDTYPPVFLLAWLDADKITVVKTMRQTEIALSYLETQSGGERDRDRKPHPMLQWKARREMRCPQDLGETGVGVLTHGISLLPKIGEIPGFQEHLEILQQVSSESTALPSLLSHERLSAVTRKRPSAKCQTTSRVATSVLRNVNAIDSLLTSTSHGIVSSVMDTSVAGRHTAQASTAGKLHLCRSRSRAPASADSLNRPKPRPPGQ